MQLSSLFVALSLFALGANAHARQASVLAFSKDGSQALLETYDRDRREGGSRFTYLVVGGGEPVSVEPDNTMSHGAGREQHVTPKECVAAMKTLQRALRGFVGVKIRMSVCQKKERSDLLEIAERAQPNGDFAPKDGALARGDLTLSSDGEKVVLARAGTTVATFALQIPKELLGATISPTGRLLLLCHDPACESVAAIAQSKTGRPEDFVLRPNNE
jgi:hypothetical protein